MMLLLLSSLALANSVKIEAEGPGVVRVRATEATLYMPACAGVSWERFDRKSGEFVPVSNAPCGPMAPAIQVDIQGIKVELSGLLPNAEQGGAHVVRAVVVVAEKCSENKPFPLAECEGVARVFGPNQTVYMR